MPIGPGGLDSNGIWQFGEDDSEALASDLLNLGMGSVSTAISTLGGVLQVVSTTKTDTFSASTASGAFTAVTGLSAAITPSATSSKILVRVTLVGASSRDSGAGMGDFRIKRDSTAIAIGDAAGSRARLSGAALVSVGYALGIVGSSAEVLDTPSSTSAITYSVDIYNSSSSTETLYVNRTDNNSDSATRPRAVSTITLMEVAG